MKLYRLKELSKPKELRRTPKRSLCAALNGSFDCDRLKRIEKGIKKATKQANKEFSFGLYCGRLACESRDQDVRDISREAHRRSEVRKNQVADLVSVKEALIKGNYI